MLCSFFLDQSIVPLSEEQFPATEIELNTDYGTCTCDLTLNHCDINCCCDAECSSNDKSLFSECTDDSTPKDDKTYLCKYSTISYEDYSTTASNVINPNVFCVWRERSSERNYYLPVELAKTDAKFDEYSQTVDSFDYSYQAPSSSNASLENFYKSGQLLLTYSGNSSNLVTDIFSLPSSSFSSSSCLDRNPARFLFNESTSCLRLLSGPLSNTCESEVADSIYLNADLLYTAITDIVSFKRLLEKYSVTLSH